jgi:Protein of unknown function (DUF2842)
MHPRTRKLIGAVALLVLITVYALLAMLVTIVLQTRNIGWFGELAYYVVAGLLWVLPAGVIVWWMQKSAPKQEG